MLIDGKLISNQIKEELHKEVLELKETYGRTPKLAVILVGDDPASHVYVRNKEKACAGCLFLNEVSCRHFNKDLNRSYLCGYFDNQLQKKLKGYWEI